MATITIRLTYIKDRIGELHTGRAEYKTHSKKNSEYLGSVAET